MKNDTSCSICFKTITNRFLRCLAWKTTFIWSACNKKWLKIWGLHPELLNHALGRQHGRTCFLDINRPLQRTLSISFSIDCLPHSTNTPKPRLYKRSDCKRRCLVCSRTKKRVNSNQGDGCPWRVAAWTQIAVLQVSSIADFGFQMGHEVSRLHQAQEHNKNSKQ